jgi:hypothetical protein
LGVVHTENSEQRAISDPQQEKRSRCNNVDKAETEHSQREILASFASKFSNTGSALILMSLMWLVTGIGAYYGGYEYGLNNLAYGVAFTNVGAAYRHRRIVSGLAAAISSFQMVLVSTRYIPGAIGLGLSVFLFAIISLDYFIERGKEDFVKVGPKLKRWLGIHLHVFAFLGLMHFPFLYFLIRLPYGTEETFLAVQIFQAEALFIGLVGIYEKAKPKLWGFDVPKIGFAYIILVTLSGLILEMQTYLLIVVAGILAFYWYSLNISKKLAGGIQNVGM